MQVVVGPAPSSTFLLILGLPWGSIQMCLSYRMVSCSVVSNFCDPVDSSTPSSSVHSVLQARIMKWVAISFSGDLPDSGTEPRPPELKADFLPTEPPGKSQSSQLRRHWLCPEHCVVTRETITNNQSLFKPQPHSFAKLFSQAEHVHFWISPLGLTQAIISDY